MKFGMFIVFDETNILNIFFKSIGPEVGIRHGPNILYRGFLLYIIPNLEATPCPDPWTDFKVYESNRPFTIMVLSKFEVNRLRIDKVVAEQTKW